MAYDLKVRRELNNLGITNDQIGYDQNTGYVTVGGQNFMQPQKNYQGTTFTDRNTFNNAWRNYQKSMQQPAAQSTQQTSQQNPYQGSLFTPTHQGMSWQQALPYYAQNQQEGQRELQRAQQALGVYQSLGDTERAQGAERWINQLNQAMGVNPNANPQDARIQGAIDQLMTQSQQPYENPLDTQIQNLIASITNQVNNRQPFDPYSSPEFAAHEARSQRAAQQGIRAAQEALGSAGFGRSTALGERAQGIQNEQEDFLRTQVIPQIIAQNEAREQQQIQNLMATLNPMMQQQGVMDGRNQQQFQNQLSALNPMLQQQGVFDDRQRFDQQFDYQRERDAVGDQRFEQQFEYQQARDAIADERYKQEFDEDVRRFGLQFALNRSIQQGQLDVSRMNASTSRMNAQTNQNELAWRQQQAQQEPSGGFTQEQINSYNNLLGAYTQSNRDPQEALRTATSPQGYKNALDYGLSEGLYRQMVSELESRAQTPRSSTNDVTADYITNLDQIANNPNVNIEDVLNAERANIVRDIGVSGYNSLVRMYADDNSALLRSILEGE